MDALSGIPPLDVDVVPGDLLAQGEIQRLGRLAGQAGNRSQELRSAAQEFEGYMLAYLLRIMRETVPKGMVESKAADHFLTFYDQELGRRAAEAGGIGIGRLVEEYLRQAAQMDGGSQVRQGPRR